MFFGHNSRSLIGYITVTETLGLTPGIDYRLDYRYAVQTTRRRIGFAARVDGTIPSSIRKKSIVLHRCMLEGVEIRKSTLFDDILLSPPSKTYYDLFVKHGTLLRPVYLVVRLFLRLQIGILTVKLAEVLKDPTHIGSPRWFLSCQTCENNNSF